MEIVAEMEAPCPPAQLFAWVEDLARYPEWLEIVTRAEPLAARPAGGAGSRRDDAPGRETAECDITDRAAGAADRAAAPADREAGPDRDHRPAWAVDLRGRIGPLARSKRLRMVRTVHDAPHRVRFERAELDGRTHSPWTLEVEITGDAEAAHLTMWLRYGGGLFGPVLERVLRDEIDRSRQRLRILVDGGAVDGAGRP